MTISRRGLLAAGSAAALGACARGPAGLQPSPRDTVAVAAPVPADWEVGPAEAHGLPPRTLEGAFGAGAQVPGLRSLVVVRDGVLIGERSYGGAAPSQLQPVNSVTKSVSALLVGLAVERGSLSLDAPLRTLLPDAVAGVPDSPLADTRLDQVLAGRSGIGFDPFRANELGAAADPVRFALELPRTPPTPSGWTYNDPVVGLLSAVLERAERRDIAALAERDLFAPLGITRFAWRRDRQGRPLSYAGLALPTRDLAKLAWTMANGGVWRGVQVVPSRWVARSTVAHGPADWRLPPIEDIGYSDLWFVGTIGGRRVVWAWGYGGQFALFAPELRLAVATAATSPPRAQLATQTNAIMAIVAPIVRTAA